MHNLVIITGTSRQRSGKDSHFKNRSGKKLNLESGTYVMKTCRKPNEQLFSKRWPLSYLNLPKNMKTYIRRHQHKHFKHQNIKQKEPPQKYRDGTISDTKLLAGLNRFYMAITSPSASADWLLVIACSINPRPHYQARELLLEG